MTIPEYANGGEGHDERPSQNTGLSILVSRVVEQVSGSNEIPRTPRNDVNSPNIANIRGGNTQTANASSKERSNSTLSRLPRNARLQSTAKDGEQGGNSQHTAESRSLEITGAVRVDHISVEQAQDIYQGYRNRHTMKKIFSKSRNVEQVVTHPRSFHYCLTTYAQQRTVERANRPYKAGERIPKISSRATVPDKWDVECELTDGQRVVIPNTTVKVECKACCATGASCCHTCTGGKTSCYHCDGSGRTMRTETQSDGDAPKTHIKYESCHYCHNEGRVQCNRCGGRGRIQCRICGGAKHMVEWEQVVLTITKTESDEFSRTVPPDVDRAKLKRGGGYRYFTEKAKDGALAPLHGDTCVDQGIVADSRKLLATHKAVRGRVIKQEHYISLIPFHCAYLDKPGEYFYIVGTKHTPTFPKADKSSCSIM